MQLRISYAPPQAELAQQISDDLKKSNLRLDGNYLLVLVTPQLVADDAAIKEVRGLQQKGFQVVPVVIEQANLPVDIPALPPLNMTGSYRADKVRVYLRSVDITPDVKRRNRILTLVVVGFVIAIFTWAIIGLGTGQMGPPTDEFATEYAVQQEMISEFMRPTLESFQPRTTDEAVGFPQTVEAVTTRVQPFLIATATAQAGDIQATQAVIGTSAAQTQTSDD